MVFFRGSNSPGVLDGFATCLSGKGVIVYGNDFCSYTSKQLNLFGKSKGLLNYIRCIDDEGLCDSKGIKITPTWEIDDRLYSGVKGLDVISELSGCIL
ncbi:hypothetical protein COU61_01845 [Candidatus Pacearchaeota archaeon CG10_big_fil_rev_8_21_14_0_10_35_13]|nr:MAG: hypothetical protein COU61_01845 [Candidatus Pacearchaeota archaeon CG10_big_fil_rev_8_21_14_0_10_35_13]